MKRAKVNSWANKVNAQRRKEEKEEQLRNEHTLLCASVFWPCFAIAMNRKGYDENQIVEVLQEMDDLLGEGSEDWIQQCINETGIQINP